MAPDGLRPVVFTVLTGSFYLFHITQGLILMDAAEEGLEGWMEAGLRSTPVSGELKTTSVY